MTRARGIPLILDQAYGMPFPGAIYVDWQPLWDEDMIVSISLSKLGLPGVRTSVIVAHEKHRHRTGQHECRDGASRMATSARPLLKPTPGRRYPAESSLARSSSPSTANAPPLPQGCCTTCLRDKRPLWAACTGRCLLSSGSGSRICPSPAPQLYQRLKQRKVLIVPGHYFFFGLDEPWAHRDQCLRITFSQSPEIVQ
jgi:valine--pyruvate aminotransferase